MWGAHLLEKHDYEELHPAFEKYKVEITSSLKPMEEQVTTLKKALAQLETRCREISDQRTAIDENIHVTFRRLQEVLYVKETKLIGQLDELTRDKLKGLATQRDLIETALARLNSCLHFMRESLKANNELEGDVLMMKANTQVQVQELTTPFHPYFLKPNTEANIVLSASTDMTAVCQNFGKLTPALPDPLKCHATGKGLNLAMVGEKSTPILHAIDSEGKT